MLMDLYRTGDEADPDGIVPVHENSELRLEPGERVLWAGEAAGAFGEKTDPVKGASAGFTNMWTVADKLDVTLTTMRFVYRVRKLANLRLGAGYVLAGTVGILAQKALDSFRMRNMTASGQIRLRWLARANTWQGKRHSEGISLTVVEPSGKSFIRVSMMLRTNCEDLIQMIVRAAAHDRIELCGPFRSDEPKHLEHLERQRHQPFRNTAQQGLWGPDYFLPLAYVIGRADLPLTVANKRGRAPQLMRGESEIREVTEIVAQDSAGVRSETALPETLYVRGYSFVLPHWWNDVEVPTPDVRTINDFDQWVQAAYGDVERDSSNWRQALKAQMQWCTNAFILPMSGPKYYRVAAYPHQAAVLAGDFVDFAEGMSDDHPLRKGRLWYIATFGLQAARAYQSLGKEYAALLYAEKSAAYFQPGASDPVNDQAEGAVELVKELRESIAIAARASSSNVPQEPR